MHWLLAWTNCPISYTFTVLHYRRLNWIVSNRTIGYKIIFFFHFYLFFYFWNAPYVTHARSPIFSLRRGVCYITTELESYVSVENWRWLLHLSEDNLERDLNLNFLCNFFFFAPAILVVIWYFEKKKKKKIKTLLYLKKKKIVSVFWVIYCWWQTNNDSFSKRIIFFFFFV